MRHGFVMPYLLLAAQWTLESVVPVPVAAVLDAGTNLPQRTLIFLQSRRFELILASSV